LQLDSTIGIPPNRLSGKHKGFYGDQVVVALPFAAQPVLGHHVYKAQVFFILIHKEVGHVSYLVIFAVKDASTAKVVLRTSRMLMFRQHNDVHLTDTPPCVILGLHLSHSSTTISSRLLFLDQYTPARRALQGFLFSNFPLTEFSEVRYLGM
jgi:hypothetical protein